MVCVGILLSSGLSTLICEHFDDDVFRLLDVTEICATSSSAHHLEFKFRYVKPVSNLTNVYGEHWVVTITVPASQTTWPKSSVDGSYYTATLDSSFNRNTDNNLIKLRLGTGPAASPDGTLNVLDSGDLRFTFEEKYYYKLTENATTEELITYTRTTKYPVIKKLATDGSVDSRRSFSRISSSGNLEADPNADYSNINFGAWAYKGGLFAGRMIMSQTGDYSGFGRTQLYVTEAPSASDLRFVLAAIRPLAYHSGGSGSMVLRGYIPTVTTTNDMGEMTATWETRWDINNSPPSGWDGPMPTLTITPETMYDGNLYKSFPLTPTEEPVSGGVLGYRYYSSVPEGVRNGAVIADIDEESTTDSRWLYFAGREYLSERQTLLSEGFPWTDSRARLWYVKKEDSPSETINP